MTSEQLTQPEQRLEQVASIIYELGYTFEQAQLMNDGDGWTYDVRWCTQEYVSDTDYTRVACDKLTEQQLRQAYAMAEEWRR